MRQLQTFYRTPYRHLYKSRAHHQSPLHTRLLREPMGKSCNPPEIFNAYNGQLTMLLFGQKLRVLKSMLARHLARSPQFLCYRYYTMRKGR